MGYGFSEIILIIVGISILILLINFIIKIIKRK